MKSCSPRWLNVMQLNRRLYPRLVTMYGPVARSSISMMLITVNFWVVVATRTTEVWIVCIQGWIISPMEPEYRTTRISNKFFKILSSHSVTHRSTNLVFYWIFTWCNQFDVDVQFFWDLCFLFKTHTISSLI